MGRHRGFTLVELMIVMVIIGILITFILKASSNAVRRAEEKATIALVAKLEQAMTDRVDALTTYQADPMPAHYALAAIYPSTGGRIESVQRAQVVAQFDYLRAQLPDVFVSQSTATTAGSYPFNFAGQAYINGSSAVPLGADNGVNGTITGMYGAAFEIAGGIYKQLGYHPNGYDGNDNNNDGYIDDAFEGTDKLSADEQAVVVQRISKHTHKTARAEMLYAILVEGGGTYGSSFDKDDFTSREVQDTDGDGLMEFVDAWGEPLQFYRWPILYRSDSQKGFPDLAKLTQDDAAGVTPGPYASAYEAREQNPLDPNQTLMAPAWWGAQYNSSAKGLGAAVENISIPAVMFMRHFGPCLIDPLAMSVPTRGPSSATYWDRSSQPTPASTGPIYYRRAYYSRFLILSAGPDKIPGTAQLGTDYKGGDDRSTIDVPGTTVARSARDNTGGPVSPGASVTFLLIESQGGKVDIYRGTNLGGLTITDKGRNDTNSQLEYYSQDDISSQNLQATGGVLQ